ncbi:DUF6879 family protein [Streptomyces sp. AC154]|uniref:DUF6879 family protein n=1 Tax=Streptomyces sp. AC154 TaxID=3143184 RepID=UPI003F7ECCB2
MLSPQSDGCGLRLGLDDYSEDFSRHFWRSGSEGFWKLERQQSFQEPGVESWEAFRKGHWDESVALIEAQRGHYEEYFQRITESGFAWRAVGLLPPTVTEESD